MEQRNCALCGKPFASESAVRIYCSRKCGRRVANANLRGTAVRPPVGPFDCASCGTRCVPGENVPPNAEKFCGARCKRRWHVDFSPSHAEVQRRNNHRTAAIARLSRAKRGTSGNGRWAGHTCSECGVSFVARLNSSDKRARNVYCGTPCKNRYFARVRRAQLRNVGMGDPVRRHEIAKRDGYRCQLCRKPVNRDAVVPHPKAPVLDHIIPLAKGGTHEPTNVQLAHFMCNSIKSDNIGGAGDQLRLIG